MVNSKIVVGLTQYNYHAYWKATFPKPGEIFQVCQIAVDFFLSESQ